MKDAYLGTIKGDQLEQIPQYRIDDQNFTGKVAACKYLYKNGFTLKEGLEYLSVLEDAEVELFSPVSSQERFIQRKLVQAS
jgi:hypothetical protein